MKLKIWKKSAVIFFSILLVGCVNSVPQVNASLPLVSAENAVEVGQSLPLDLSELVDNNHSGQALAYRDYQVVLGRNFYSALGQHCKEIHFSELAYQNKSYLRVVCQSKNSSWRLMPIITEQTSLNINMEESK